MSNTLGHTAGVDEDQCGVVLLDHVGDLIEQLGHHFCRRQRLELTLRKDQLEVEFSLVAGIDNGAVGCASSIVAHAANQQSGYGLDGSLGG